MCKAESAAVAEVRRRIDQAAVKSGRTGKDVTLVAVTKYSAIGDPVVDSLIAAGCGDLGESRPQTLLEKAQHYGVSHYGNAGDPPLRWHLIGSLQRNKVRKLLPAVHLIHSLDSVKLAEAIDRIADEEHLPPVHCLLETSISHDAAKRGVPPEEVPKTLEQIGKCRNVIVDGLMGMAGLESTKPEVRREFALLRETAEKAKRQGLPGNVPLTELSMGMSGDFEIAIEEGATLVRVGSLLYNCNG